jgi:phosphoribosyl-ATP pyrophosphohydrolase
MPNSQDIVAMLHELIQDRKQNPPEKSYVNHLLDGGVERIGAKVMEEAGELVEAAGDTDHAHTVYEAADLLFHALVLLEYHDIEPQDVLKELERRFGVSGITEKENRK